jgi:hypothetical protein
MIARYWKSFVVAAAILSPIYAASPARAAIQSPARFIDTAFVATAPQTGAAFIASDPLALRSDTVVVASAFGQNGERSAIGERSAFDTAYGSDEYGNRAGESPEISSSEMTRQDFALMMLFAGALVAYQLDRKQRVLRQSSLSELSLVDRGR